MAFEFNPQNPAFMDSYNAVSNIANNEAQQVPNNAAVQANQPDFPMREMNFGERLASASGALGNSLASASGFPEYFEKHGRLASLLTPEGLARFAINLPMGMASAIPTGISNLYAGITGSDTTYGALPQQGMIREEKLDPGQRAASITTGLVDTLGLLFGGSGSLIGETSRAITAGKGGIQALEKAEQMNKGFLNGAAWANRGKLTPSQAIAFDVAEEAGEEGVQSFSEDVIQKQLNEGTPGRVFEGAFMGALGGGMMSGAAMAMRSLTNEQIDKGLQMPDVQTGQQDSSANPWAWLDKPANIQLANGIENTTKTAQEQSEEIRLQQQVGPQDGSITVMLLGSEKYKGFAEMGFTVGELKTMLRFNQTTTEDLANFFSNNTGRISAKDVTDVLLNQDENTAAETLTSWIKQYYPRGMARVALKRDPATDMGYIWAYVTGVDPGYGLQLSGTLAKAIGGDYDSDRGSIFLNPQRAGVVPKSWAYDQFLRFADQGGTKQTTKYEWDFSSLKRIARDAEIKNAEDAVKAQLMTLNGLNDADLVDRLIAPVFAAYRQEGEGRDLAISQALHKFAVDVDDQVGTIDTLPASHVAIETLFNTFGSYAENEAQIVDDRVKVFKNVIFSNIHNEFDEELVRKAIAHAGFTDTYGTATKLNEAGMPEVFLSSQRNQLYRNYATAIYQFSKTEEGRKSLTDFVGKLGMSESGTQTSAFGWCIIWGSKLVASGEDPSDSVVGLVSDLIRTDYNVELKKIEAQRTITIQDRIDVFEKVYRSWAKVKNDALKKLSKDIYVPQINAVDWKEDLSYKEHPLDFGREFLRIFGSESFGSVFSYMDGATSQEVGDKSIFVWDTLEKTVSDAIRFKLSTRAMAFSDDENEMEFFDTLVKSQKAMPNRVEQYARKLLESFNLSNILDRYNANEELDMADLQALLAYTEAVSHIMGPRLAFEAAFIDPVNWMQATEFRDKMMSRDIDERLNAITSMNFRQKFWVILDWQQKHLNDPTARWDEKVENEATLLSNIDEVHKNIVEELRAAGKEHEGHGRSGTLEFLVSPDNSYAAKKDFINNTYAAMDGRLKDGLLVSAIRTKTSPDSLQTESSILTQMRQARVPLATFKKALQDLSIEQVNELKKSLLLDSSASNHISDSVFVETFNEMTLLATTQISVDVICEVMADAANYSNRQPEKGSTLHTAHHLYMQVDYAKNGAQTSFIADQFNTPLGMSVLQDLWANPQIILRLLADPNYSLKVVDDKTGQSVMLTRDIIFSAVSSQYNSEKGPTASDILQLLDVAPTLVSYLGGLGTSSRDSQGSTPRDTPASTGTFWDLCVGRSARKTDGRAQKRHEIALDIDRVRNAFLNDARTISYVYACLKPDEQALVAQGLTPSRKHVQDILDRMAKSWYAAAIKAKRNGKGIESKEVVNSFFDAGIMPGFIGRVERFSADLDLAFARSTGEALNVFEGTAEEFMTSLLEEDLMAMMLEDYKNDLGIDISHVRVRNLATKKLTAANEAKINISANKIKTIFNLHLAVAQLMGFEQFGAFSEQFVKDIATYIDNTQQRDGAAIDLKGKTSEQVAQELAKIWMPEGSSTAFITPQLSSAMDPSLSEDDRLNRLNAFIDHIATETHNRGYLGRGKPARDELIDLYKSAWDRGGTNPQRQDFRPFLLKCYSYILADTANQLSVYSDGNMNPYMARDYAEYFEYVESVFNNPNFTGLVSDYDVYANAEDEIYIDEGRSLDDIIGRFPQPDFSDRRTSLLHRQMQEVVMSGRVISEVGHNGMMNAELAGIDMVANKPFEFVTGDVRKWSDINADQNLTDRRFVRKIVNGKPAQGDEGNPVTIAQLRGANPPFAVSPNDDFEVFNPMINPHGVCLGPVMASTMHRPGLPYKHVIAYLNQMQMESMENLVLKVRKNFGKGGSWDLGRNRRTPAFNDGHYVPCRTDSLEHAIEDYNKFIDEAAKYLKKNSLYSADLASIGFDYDEFLAVVQMMTPGIDIELNDGSHATIDIKHLYDGTWESQLARFNGQIKNASLLYLPLTAISSRIENSVMTLDPTVSGTTVGDTAWNAMFDWDGYESNTLDVKKILKGFPTLGRQSNLLYGERDISGVQYVYREIVKNIPPNKAALLAGKIDEYNSYFTTINDDNPTTAQGHIAQARKIVRNELRQKDATDIAMDEMGTPVSIGRVFGTDWDSLEIANTTDSWHLLKEFTNALSDLSRPENKYFNSGGKDSVLVMSKDEDDFLEAIAFAMATQSDILIPKNFIPRRVVRRNFLSTLVEVPVEEGRNRSQTVAMYRIKYQNLSYNPNFLFTGPQARNQIVVPGDYFQTIYLDEKGTYSSLGDSVTLLLRSVAKKMGFTGEERGVSIDLNKYTENDPDLDGLRYTYSMLTPEELAAIANLTDGDTAGWKPFERSFSQLADPNSGFGHYGSQMGLRNAVRNCAKNLQTATNGQAALKNLRGGNCAYIVKVTDRAGRTLRYIPVMIPRNVGKIAQGHCIYSNNSSSVVISAAEEVNLAGRKGQSWFFKWDLTDVAADKTMVKIVDSLGDDCYGFDAVHNWSTPSGRMSGRDVPMLYRNLSRSFTSAYMHFLLEPTPRSQGELKFKLADWFVQQAAQSGIPQKTYISNTLYGVLQNSLWGDMLSGKYNFPPGVDTSRISWVFNKVIKQAENAGISIMSLFGAGQFEVVFDDNGIPTGDVKMSRMQECPDLDLAFDGLTYDDILDFYYVIGNRFKFCQNSTGDAANAGKLHFAWDSLGRKQVKVKGQLDYARVFITPLQYMGHATSIETPGNEATLSAQQRLNQLAYFGMDNDSAEFAVSYARAHRMGLLGIDQFQHQSLSELASEEYRNRLEISGPLLNAYIETKQLRDLEQRAKDAITFQRTILPDDPNGKFEYGSEQNGYGVREAVQRLGDAIGWHDISLDVVHYLVNSKNGATLGNGENSTIYADTFVKIIDEIISDFKQSGYKTLIRVNRNTDELGRIEIPVIDPSVLDLICRKSSKLNRDTYVEEMWKEEALAIAKINKLTESSQAGKQRELRLEGASRRLLWDDDAHPWNEGYDFIFGSFTMQEMIGSDSKWALLLKNKGFDMENYVEAAGEGQRLMTELSQKLHHKDSRKKLEDSTYYGSPVYADHGKTSDVVTKTMNTTISLSRLAAIANPGVFIGNTAGRVAASTVMEGLMNLGVEYGFGPFATAKEYNISKDVLTRAVNEQDVKAVWNALRHFSLVEGDIGILAGSRSTQEMISKMNEYLSNQGKFNKTLTDWFDFANGGNFMTKQQARLFFERLPQFMATDARLGYYFEQVEGTGRTLLENEVYNDPARFLIECFSGARPELYLAAQNAMNSALELDMAQRNSIDHLLRHFISKTTLGDFAMTTMVCKFPKYQFNLLGKYIQWFAPASTTYMLLTRAMQMADEAYSEKNPDHISFHFEADQRFATLREAMAYDMTHMGAAPLMAILLMVANAIEPPDDEKKWGDPDEWLIGGNRIGESWWLSDVLGAFTPTVLFVKSMMLGNPTSSLLINGTLSACYGNPFLRATDVANVLVDWDDGVLTDYEHVKELYANADGGAPGLLDWIQSDAVAGLGNWATGLICPSFIKELYRNSQPYEKSYNRVYQTTSTGKLSEAGEKGYTEKTNYQDAMIRKFCRTNPFFAIVMNTLNPSAPTGYWLSDMPDTLYTDPAQMASAETYSVKGLDEEQANNLMWKIYLYMDNHTVEEMQQDGFYLDKQTLYAFGSWLWDAYYRQDDLWNQMQARGDLSYSALGEGDWELGQQIYAELLQEKKNTKARYYNMYYDKVRGSYLNRGMQQYRRYTTSYRTDSEGNVYATGMHRQGVLPFVSAPGTVTNPEGTAGYENDFMSISAVTGLPMDQRALVPVDPESLELPNFEGFSKNSDGNGYSTKWSQYANGAGSGTGFDGDSNPNASTTPKASTYSTRSSSSGGGGGSRRSSGGGSSYVPNISSRNYSPNAPNAAVGRFSRNYDTQFDYLRPNVETKGSRDAYKRGDI